MKRPGNKRISRRELKEENRKLKTKIKFTELDCKLLKDEIKKMNERFKALGSVTETIDVPGINTITVEIKPQAFGNFAKYIKGTPLDQETVEKELIKRMVEGLMAQNYIQFFHQNAPWEKDIETIGAKLFVVPWDQMAVKRIYREVIKETP